MQQRFFIIWGLILILLSACKKDEKITPAPITVVLKRIVNDQGVQALQNCCVGCSCSQSIGYGEDYEFIGDHIVRIQRAFFDLNKLQTYEVKDVSFGTTTERRMVLYFDK